MNAARIDRIVRVLHQLHFAPGERHGFAAYGTPEQRATGIENWRSWAREKGKEARWTAVDDHLGEIEI